MRYLYYSRTAQALSSDTLVVVAASARLASYGSSDYNDWCNMTDISNRSHILVDGAARRPHREQPDMPAGVRYDALRGYWADEDGLVSDLPPPQSKKADFETGEDMKGE